MEDRKSMQSLLYKGNVGEWQQVKQRMDSAEGAERVWLGQSFEIDQSFNAASEVEAEIEDEMNSSVVESSVTGNQVEENELQVQASSDKGLTPLGWGIVALIGYMVLKGK